MKSARQPDYIFVCIQLILFALYFILPHPASDHLLSFWTYAGTVILFTGVFLILAALIQLNKNISMMPTPVSSSKLITTGVFKYIRHPIYSGIFLSALGYGLFENELIKIVGALIILLFFDIKSDYEENKLTDKFPEYTNYKKRTGKFTPRFIKPY